MVINSIMSALKHIRDCFATASGDDRGIGVVEVILILVEKPNAKHRYVLCGK